MCVAVGESNPKGLKAPAELSGPSLSFDEDGEFCKAKLA
jgi:hypothetical protein